MGRTFAQHRVSEAGFRGDALVIRSGLDIKPVTSLRRYEIAIEAGALLAKAETDWAFVNRRNQRPTRIPEEVKAGFIVYRNSGTQGLAGETAIQQRSLGGGDRLTVNPATSISSAVAGSRPAPARCR